MNIQNIDLFEMHEPLTSSFPFAAMTAVLPWDISSVSIHWQDTMEILLIREGTGRVSIDLEKISIKKGDICLILPGQLHTIDKKRLKDKVCHLDHQILLKIDKALEISLELYT